MGNVVDISKAGQRRIEAGSAEIRAMAANVKGRGNPDRAGLEEERPSGPMTDLERVHNLNKQAIVEDLTSKARKNPAERMDPVFVREAEQIMSGFKKIDAEMEAEIEKFRNGTYSTDRLEEYILAADRVRLAMYLLDTIREIHQRVLEADRNSLLRIFLLAAQGVQNMLSNKYFQKNGWEIMIPGNWGYMDFRVEPPLIVCAQETRVTLLTLDEATKSRVDKLIERIKAT